MLNRIASVIRAAGSHLTESRSPSRDGQESSRRAGDVLVRNTEGGWQAVKLLAVDKCPEGNQLAHCLCYAPLDNKPSAEGLQYAEVESRHTIMDVETFDTGWEKLAHVAPNQNELAGFAEYLKQTDFPRYITITGQNAREIVHQANDHYKRARQLVDEAKPFEAIAEFGKAIELFPLFYEALDHRGHTQMTLGNHRAALDDFVLSLWVHPNGMVALLAKGDCLMALGDHAAAEAIFQEGRVRFPEHRPTFTERRDQAHARSKQA